MVQSEGGQSSRTMVCMPAISGAPMAQLEIWSGGPAMVLIAAPATEPMVAVTTVMAPTPNVDICGRSATATPNPTSEATAMTTPETARWRTCTAPRTMGKPSVRDG